MLTPYALALLAGLGALMLCVAEVYRVLGREWFAAMWARAWRRALTGRDDDDDPYGHGGGFA